MDQAGGPCQGGFHVVESRLSFWRPRHHLPHGCLRLGPRGHLVKRGHDLGCLRDESLVEIDHSDEDQFSHGHRAGKVGDSLDAFRGGSDSVCGGSDSVWDDVVSKEAERWFAKKTLFRVENEAGGLESVEQLLEVVSVFFLVLARHQNVVQVDERKGKTLADGVHQPLEGLGGIFKPEGGPQKLEKSERRDNGGFVDVFWGHGDLMTPPDKVDFSKALTPMQLG